LNHDLDGYICAKNITLLDEARMYIEELNSDKFGNEVQMDVILIDEKFETYEDSFIHINENITDINNQIVDIKEGELAKDFKSYLRKEYLKEFVAFCAQPATKFEWKGRSPANIEY